MERANHISIITTNTITLCFNLSTYKHLGGQGCETVQYWTVLRPIHHNYINQRPLFSPFQSVQTQWSSYQLLLQQTTKPWTDNGSYLCNNQNHNNNHHLTNLPICPLTHTTKQSSKQNLYQHRIFINNLDHAFIYQQTNTE